MNKSELLKATCGWLYSGPLSTSAFIVVVCKRNDKCADSRSHYFVRVRIESESSKKSKPILIPSTSVYKNATMQSVVFIDHCHVTVMAYGSTDSCSHIMEGLITGNTSACLSREQYIV